MPKSKKEVQPPQIEGVTLIQKEAIRRSMMTFVGEGFALVSMYRMAREGKPIDLDRVQKMVEEQLPSLCEGWDPRTDADVLKTVENFIVWSQEAIRA